MLKHATFEEIFDYLRRESELQDYDLTTSKRTFARDLEDIGSIYGIYIRYDFSSKFYYIEEEFEPEINDRMLEALDMYCTLEVQERQLPYFQMERHSPQGTEHIYGLLHAIKNRLQITFGYRKYYSDHPDNRTVEPLVLKEFKNRWYLFAKDNYDGLTKCYALDRFSELEISSVHFASDERFDVNEQLKYCFGIMSPNAENPSEILLSFDPFQGKYIKSLPLHETQEIVDDGEDELLVRLTVYLTHDFLMELLSFGDTVKVLKPQQLIDDLKRIYTNALMQY
jgi:predicted DNA-binding transcriptional regulator YafY